MFDREEIANKLADEGWCPDSTTEYNEDVGGYYIIKEMFISDDMIDEYVAEERMCAAEAKNDELRDDRLTGDRE